MLVAMALMSVLAMSLYGSLHIAFKARRSAVAVLGPVRAAQVAVELVGEDIKSALAPTGVLAGEFLGEDDTGDLGRDADTLLLYSSANCPREDEIASDTRKIELGLTSPSDGEEMMLVRNITTNLLSPTVLEPREEILCRNVLAFNLRYFDGTDWQDSWDSSSLGNILPDAVEVTLEVQRPSSNQADAEGYSFQRVFLIPCSGSAEEEGEIRRSSN